MAKESYGLVADFKINTEDTEITEILMMTDKG
jgi:hypothetical protein